jgi:ribosomal protein L25 (general stress protein Ctc)
MTRRVQTPQCGGAVQKPHDKGQSPPVLYGHGLHNVKIFLEVYSGNNYTLMPEAAVGWYRGIVMHITTIAGRYSEEK